MLRSAETPPIIPTAKGRPMCLPSRDVGPLRGRQQGQEGRRPRPLAPRQGREGRPTPCRPMVGPDRSPRGSCTSAPHCTSPWRQCACLAPLQGLVHRPQDRPAGWGAVRSIAGAGSAAPASSTSAPDSAPDGSARSCARAPPMTRKAAPTVRAP